ncbi:MAG: hypothetical protein LBB11_01470 [Puniceicoccales bacterium]|jgi:hypothetical protein|nr:hypothetical protein [Puniceicoccales bacterium]
MMSDLKITQTSAKELFIDTCNDARIKIDPKGITSANEVSTSRWSQRLTQL